MSKNRVPQATAEDCSKVFRYPVLSPYRRRFSKRDDGFFMDLRYRGPRSQPLITGPIFLQATGKKTAKLGSQLVVLYLDRRLSRYLSSGSKLHVEGAYGPGASAMAMQMELLVAQGARDILIVGTAGSLSVNLKIGDVVMVTEAMIDEGTSPHYGFNPGSMVAGTASFQERFPKLWPRVKAWTTDAPFREYPEAIKHYQKEGFSVVDMECSCAFALGKIHNVNVASVLVLSDEIHAEKWTSGLRSEALLQGFERVGQMLASL